MLSFLIWVLKVEVYFAYDLHSFVSETYKLTVELNCVDRLECRFMPLSQLFRYPNQDCLHVSLHEAQPDIKHSPHCELFFTLTDSLSVLRVDLYSLGAK